MFHDRGGGVCGVRASEGLLVDDGDSTSVFVGSAMVRFLYVSGVAVAMSCMEAGFSQVAVMKMMFGVWAEIMFQISAACLLSEHALSRMPCS